MPSPFAHHWTLEPGLDFLNHGSFGAAPRPVLAAQQAWRERIEREPVRFFAHDYEDAMDAAAIELAQFVGVSCDDLAWLPNATTGVSTVLRSLHLQPGDELLTTDHAYNAVKNAMERAAAAAGGRVVEATVPFPIEHSSQIVDAVLGAVTRRTRLAVLDHVTSATALVLPLEQLVPELAARGIETLVDGAHAPGMLDLRIGDLGAAYYTGNLHKWICAPKGAAFLWVRSDLQPEIRPLVTSHGANSPRPDRSQFRLEFDWTGTTDPTPYLAVPAALRFGESLMPGGWDALRGRNRHVAVRARDLVSSAAGAPAPAPEPMLGCMASVALAPTASPFEVQGIDLYADPLHAALLARGFQVMVTPWPQRPRGGGWRRLIRLSAAAYNDVEQFERLAKVLPQVLAELGEAVAPGARQAVASARVPPA